MSYPRLSYIALIRILQCVLVCGSQVLKVGTEAVAIWDSPTRSRNTSPCPPCIRLASQTNHPRVQSVARIMRYPSPLPPDRDRLLCLPQWHQQSVGHQSIIFDVFFDTHRDPATHPVEMSRYRVDLHSLAGELVDCTLTAESPPLPLPLPKRVSPVMRRISTSRLVSFRAEGNYGQNIICATYTLAGDSISITPVFMSGDYTSWVALCPVSGRALRKTDSDLLVVDFLST
ncbi:hypothetical protein FA13DRAFT_710976 [Coprinellus micaceus]|uniref:Uncharacterized protein n=1 Tax=Coprinellus micaceus TaxID=71717 RepID=A0A4Y7TVE7_COPMI|nr:hypothetical protein FA13DRAFT_710976 [Coprinellus micaceus]